MTNPWFVGSLFRKRLNTWEGRLRGDDAPYTFSHTTKFGVVSLRPIFPLNILQCGVYLDDRFIATLPGRPAMAASIVGTGELDTELGFRAADGVPADLGSWNGSIATRKEAS